MGKCRQNMENAMHRKSHDDILRNIIANLKIDDYAKSKFLVEKFRRLVI